MPPLSYFAGSVADGLGRCSCGAGCQRKLYSYRRHSAYHVWISIRWSCCRNLYHEARLLLLPKAPEITACLILQALHQPDGKALIGEKAAIAKTSHKIH